MCSTPGCPGGFWCPEGFDTPPPAPAAVMNWVRQEDAEGCGVAVLAMLTGQTYAAVRDELEADEWVNHGGDWRTNGVTQIVLERYLAQRGGFFRRVYAAWEFGVWPPPPFAYSHYAIVANPGGGHFVAMDRDGQVLDPLREGAFSLSDWDVVNCVVGLLGVAASSTTGRSDA